MKIIEKQASATAQRQRQVLRVAVWGRVLYSSPACLRGPSMLKSKLFLSRYCFLDYEESFIDSRHFKTNLL
jgi:hypothetical protein